MKKSGFENNSTVADINIIIRRLATSKQPRVTLSSQGGIRLSLQLFKAQV
jgi:hypothetical protein